MEHFFVVSQKSKATRERDSLSFTLVPVVRFLLNVCDVPGLEIDFGFYNSATSTMLFFE